MSINLTDEIEVKTKKGKLCAAKQIFLEGDTQTVEKEIQDINSRHNDLSSKHESLSSTVSEHTQQIESNQSQITANKSAQDEKNTSLDANMAKLNTRDDQITELVKNVTATGGASVATAVTYDNTSSNLDAVTAQGAIDELAGKDIPIHISDTWEKGKVYKGSCSNVFEHDIIKLKAQNYTEGGELLAFKDKKGNVLSTIVSDNGSGQMKIVEVEAPAKTNSISWIIVPQWDNDGDIPEYKIPYIKLCKKTLNNRGYIEHIIENTVNKDKIVQETGTSEDNIMSQKVVSEKLDYLTKNIYNNSITKVPVKPTLIGAYKLINGTPTNWGYFNAIAVNTLTPKGTKYIFELHQESVYADYKYIDIAFYKNEFNNNAEEIKALATDSYIHKEITNGDFFITFELPFECSFIISYASTSHISSLLYKPVSVVDTIGNLSLLNFSANTIVDAINTLSLNSIDSFYKTPANKVNFGAYKLNNGTPTNYGYYNASGVNKLTPKGTKYVIELSLEDVYANYNYVDIAFYKKEFNNNAEEIKALRTDIYIHKEIVIGEKNTILFELPFDCTFIVSFCTTKSYEFQIYKFALVRSLAELFHLQPYKGKKILSLGDSYTFLNYYGKYLSRVTGCSQRGRGQNGNLIRSFVNDDYSTPGADGTTHETFDAALLAQYDIVTVMGGTNDYGHGNTSIGSLDTMEEDAKLGNKCTTIYGSCSYVINKILSIKPSIKIFFCTQPFRLQYGSELAPGGYESNGRFTMEELANAIVDVCKHYGIPCFDFYHCSNWNPFTIKKDSKGKIVDNIYTYDGLHPKDGEGNGAHLLGHAFGMFINNH